MAYREDYFEKSGRYGMAGWAVGSDEEYTFLIAEVRMESVNTGTAGATPGTTAAQEGPIRQTAGVAADEAGTVAHTAGEQIRQVATEVGTQMRSVTDDVRYRVAEQAQNQSDKLVSGLRQISGELEKMAAGQEDSPARTVVRRIADSGNQAAEYLSKHGPDGVLAEVQDFARRRPGAFIAAAVVSGFVVGRLGRSVFDASRESRSSTDGYGTMPSSRMSGSGVSGTGMTGTGMTGTGMTGTGITGTGMTGTGMTGTGTTGTGTTGTGTGMSGTGTTGTGISGATTATEIVELPPAGGTL